MSQSFQIEKQVEAPHTFAPGRGKIIFIGAFLYVSGQEKKGKGCF